MRNGVDKPVTELRRSSCACTAPAPAGRESVANAQNQIADSALMPIALEWPRSSASPAAAPDSRSGGLG